MIKALFGEGSEFSMMRVVTFCCMVQSFAICWYMVAKAYDATQIATVCACFIGTGVLGKVGQKFAEKKDA